MKKEDLDIYFTKEDLDAYFEMDDKLEKMASRVASFFEEFDSDFKYSKYDTWYLMEDSNFPNEKYMVCNNGEHDSWGEHYDAYVCFEPKWLFATDEELKQHVADVLAERERKKLEKEKQQKQKEEAHYKELASLLKEELLKKLGVPTDYLN